MTASAGSRPLPAFFQRQRCRIRREVQEQRRAIQERDAEIEKLKRAIGELRARPRDAEMEQLKRLHQEQEQLLREKEMQVNKLKDHLKSLQKEHEKPQ